jgi:hypothetical protein
VKPPTFKPGKNYKLVLILSVKPTTGNVIKAKKVSELKGENKFAKKIQGNQ